MQCRTRQAAAGSGACPNIISAAFSAIIRVEALVLAEGIDGMIEESATRSP